MTNKEAKLKNLEGMKKAIETIVTQAWERGYKYGLHEAKPTIIEEAIDILYDEGWIQRHDKEMTERPKGKWDVISLLHDYVYVRCSECGQGTRLVRDSKNEFCCIKDIRDKIVACPYCGADMREVDNGKVD